MARGDHRNRLHWLTPGVPKRRSCQPITLCCLAAPVGQDPNSYGYWLACHRASSKARPLLLLKFGSCISRRHRTTRYSDRALRIPHTKDRDGTAPAKVGFTQGKRCHRAMSSRCWWHIQNAIGQAIPTFDQAGGICRRKWWEPTTPQYY
jgi:hypothetical protein